MSNRLILFGFAISLFISACGLGQPAQVSQADQTETAFAFDVIVQATLQDTLRKTEEAGGLVPPEPQPPASPDPTATPTVTVVPDTPTPTQSDTPVAPMALINQNTNCRSGPGTVYDLLYIALIGEELPIIRNSTLVDYVLVEIPGKPGKLCWLWTNYAQLFGDYQSLQKSTPPPTPTPVIDFDVVFSYVDSCVGWDPGFKLTNIGDVTFRSYFIMVTDTVTSMSMDHTADIFDKTSGCPIAQSIPQLDPGMTGYAYAYSFPNNPAGHAMTGSIKLCTGTGLGGTCLTKALSFTP
jgi:hypothetical protein